MATDNTLNLNDESTGKGGKPPSGKGSGTLKKVVMWTLGIIIVLGFAYGSGMRGQVNKLKAANAELKAARTEARAANLEVKSAEAAVKQLEARRRLHLALLELDNRNFGVAQEHLHTAAALLQEAESVSTVNFNALTGRIRRLNLVAASDISAQRAQVLALAREMDNALTDSVPKPQQGEAANSGNASAGAASTTAPGGPPGGAPIPETGAQQPANTAPDAGTPPPAASAPAPDATGGFGGGGSPDGNAPAAPGAGPAAPPSGGSAPPGGGSGNNATPPASSPPGESLSL